MKPVVRVHPDPPQSRKPFANTEELGAGGLAQLARAPALQAGAQRFDSAILHQEPNGKQMAIGA